MSKERPLWILSAYGAGRDPPRQVFGGFPREQSFEELRYRHYDLAAQGKPEQALQEAQNLVNNAEEQIRTVLNDVDGAIKYVVNGQHEHPNRIDVVKAKGIPASQANAPGQIHKPASAFALGSSAAPGFGQPPPSAFDPPPISSFGQPSALGQTATLGRPTSSFGQPSLTMGNPMGPALVSSQQSGSSSFGISQQRQSPFGQYSGASTTSLTATQKGNPFDQPGPFGQSSAPSQSNVFARPPAPTSANPLSVPSASVMTGSIAPSNPTGKPPISSSKGILGQPANAAPTSIGQSSKSRTSFANRPVPAFGFSRDSFLSSNKTFHDANTHTVHPTNAAPSNELAARRTAPSATSGIQAGDQPPERIASWQGKPVSYIDGEPCYKNQNGAWQRIWFPHGPPVFQKTPGFPEEAYNISIKEEYMFAKEHGVFRTGMVPEVPPKREWCSWEF